MVVLLLKKKENKLYHLFQCGTGSIVGVFSVPGTGTGIQRGYMTCPGTVDRSLLTFPCSSGTGLVQAACLYHVPVPHSTGTLRVPNGTGTLLVPHFRSRYLAWFRGFFNQKTKGVLIELPKFLIKNRSQFGQNSRLKSDLYSNRVPDRVFDDSHDE